MSLVPELGHAALLVALILSIVGHPCGDGFRPGAAASADGHEASPAGRRTVSPVGGA